MENIPSVERQHKNLADALEALAASQPDAPALHVPGRTSLTYADLGAHIRYVRERLAGWGIFRGEILTGVLPGRVEMGLACATLPSSCAFAPLGPSLTRDEYAQLVARMRPKAVLVPKGQDHPLRAVAEQWGVAEIEVASEADAPAGIFTLELCRRRPSLAGAAAPRPELAHILVSSGTTGRQKLVPSTHAQALLHAEVVRKFLRYSPDDVSCHLTPVHLAGGLRTGLLNPLLAGVSSVFLPESDVEAFFGALEEFRPTCFNAGFTLHRAILRRAPEYREVLRQGHFRFLRAGTGRLDPAEIDALEQAFEAPVLVALSSVETMAISHDPLPPGCRKPGAAGLPFANEVGLLDDAGRISTGAGTGEIVVRGPLVFSGYLDDPELTAASFAGDWLRTGDLGWIDEEGYVHISGRIKEIISRGGVKISPVEVDAALESFPGIREVATFGLPHPTLGEEVVAAVVPDAGAAINTQKVIEFARQRLGPLKVPRKVYFVERIPRTTNGKILRRELQALVAPQASNGDKTGGSTSPAAKPRSPLSPLEAALAGLWAPLLNVAGVGANDNFFLLGGDSLMGTQLLAKVNALFGVELSIESLFLEAGSVAGMARAIETLRQTSAAVRESARVGDGSALAPIPRRTGEEPVVLTHAQWRAWFLSRLDPGSATYNESRAHRLSGRIDSEALRGSLQVLVQRHEALRTRFTVIDDEARQIVQDGELDFESVDLSAGAASCQDDALSSLLSEAMRKPFDLENGPLARFRLIRLREDEHVLLRVWHHIVSDGWSAGIFERELSAAYDALIAGRAVELPALPLQYADYAIWQRQWLSGAVLDRQLGYWKEQLAALPTLELPTDHACPAVQSYNGARFEQALPETLSQALKTLGRAEGATLFMTLLAAFQVLLHRYSGSEDIAVGTPIAGRRRSELEGLIGFFANTLVLRVNLAGEPSFRQLLVRVRECALAAYTHQDVPFEKLVEELAPERDLSRNPLFQVCFALHNTPETTLALEGVQASALRLPTSNAKFDLTLTLREGGPGLQASWEYCTDLFDRATIERMAGHFQVLLESIVAQPEEPIGQLALLGAAERQRLLVEWNETASEYPRESCLHTLFEEQAARTPQAVAVLHQGVTLTYAELNARANRLAHSLRGQGVGPQALVGVCLERSPELMVALLGILKAGGAYVPLDPELPRERLAFLLEDTAAKLVITQQGLLGYLPEAASGCGLLCLDRDALQIDSQSSLDPTPNTTSQDLAYVMYTSGSTGRPKGACITHRGLVNYLSWAIRVYRVESAASIPVISSVAFDLTVTSLFAPLLAGRTVHLLTAKQANESLGQTLLTSGTDYSLLMLAPAHLLLLQEQVGAERARRLARALIVGGEQLNGESLRFWREHAPETAIVNEYGPTETVVGSCTYTVTGETPLQGPVPIGRPIDNTRIYLLDRHRQPVPIGVAGEAYIAGDGVGLGYWRRPELTAERFVPDSFAGKPGATMYRTGDLARYLPDGNIQFLGRLDTQVKLRGFRMELGEIEAVLVEHPAVREATVLVQENSADDKRLVAYVVAASSPFPSFKTLRGWLQKRLPSYMLPSAVVVLDHLPLMPNGKVDRRALPGATQDRGEAGQALSSPGWSLEALVADVWGEVLGIGSVGAHENFFELGGHSLRATRVISRLSSLCGLDLSLRLIFESPTVAGLTAEIERLLGAEEAEHASPIEPAERQGALPLSFAQERMWLIDRLQPGRAAYNIRSVLRFAGALDLDALRRSLNEVVARHESLRTTFTVVGDDPRQIIGPPKAIELAVIDVSGVPESERRARGLALLEEQANRPFDLEAGPLLRAAVLRLSPQEHLLLVGVHHIVSDGWSAGIFERELSAAYDALIAGRAVELPALPLQYADYAIWQRQWLSGAVLDRQLGYWKEQLAALPTLELPTDHACPAVQSYNGARFEQALPETLSQALKTLGRAEGATLFMTLLAAFQVLLHRYSGSEDIAVGTPIAGRRRSELEGLIGFFANTLVLRVNLAGEPSFRQLLVRVRECALAAYTHQDVPFEKLVEELAPERDLSRNPLFQVCFALHNTPETTLALEGVQASALRLPTSNAKFDLTLTLREGGPGLQASWEYCTDLFDRATIERMAGHFQVLLESIVAQPEEPIGQLALLGAAERQRLLVEWNETASEYPRESCLHTLFEEQAARTPQAVAVLHQGVTLTYAELNARANRLAHSLRGQGVGPQALVGVCLERSPELMVALLGILKAGGAYVPLDPELPRERLAFLLEDTAAKLVITQQGLLGYLPEAASGCGLLCLDRDALQIDSQSSLDPTPNTTSQDLAYVMYTSGSTGRPKGVAVPHRAVVRLVMNTDYVRLTPADVVAQVSTFSFDAAVFEIWGALLHGARLSIIAKDIVLSPKDFADEIQQSSITTMFLTTALLNHLVREVPGAFRNFRHLLFGGEAAQPKRVREVLCGDPPQRLLHVYGPTETTTFASWYRVESVEPDATRVPIGRPIANTRIYILDRHLQPVPIGVPGELYIGGDGLAREYLNRPALTAERFIPDPFSREAGARLYKTGDRGQFLPDGTIVFLGRVDDLVKIRGFRIELGEIEAVLAQHGAVKATAAVACEDAPGEKRLVAYVVLHAGQAVRAEELRAFLKQKLPDYMLPGQFVFLEALPMLPTGKVDRRALPAPSGRSQEEKSYAAPRNRLQHRLVKIWEELLGVYPIGIRDNFFELGGNSLLAVTVMSRIEQTYGKKLPVSTLFTSATVEDLAKHLDRQRRQEIPSPIVEVHTGGSRRPFFFLHGHYGGFYCLQLAQHLGPEQPFYALQPHGLDDQPVPPTIEAMAASHLETLRAFQPHGPYLLGGYCNGGVVAFEMARQLQELGETVELLVVIDASAKNVRFRRQHRLAAFTARLLGLDAAQQLDCFLWLRAFVTRLQEQSGLERATFVLGKATKWKTAARWARSIFSREASQEPASTTSQPAPTPDSPEEWSRSLQEKMVPYVRLMAGYVPYPYAGRLILFRHNHREHPSEEPTLGWHQVASEVDLRVIPGDHETCLTEQLQTVAEHLKGCLDQLYVGDE